MLNLLHCIMLLLSSAHSAGSAPGTASVTIPIQEYLDLRHQNELAKVTSIEEVKLRGTYGKNLTIVFSGRCSGGFDPKPILKPSESFSLSGCKGDALLDKGTDAIKLVPLARSFSLTCELRSKNWNEFEMEVLSALSFSGEITGAEVIGEESGDERKIVLSPTKQAIARNTGEITGTAKYRLTVQPEETTFRYLFKLNNPSRGTRDYEVHFVNGEVVQKVRSLATYQDAEKGMKLTLSPGDNEITIHGRYQGSAFKPLLPSEQQYLLVESHPTLQLTIQGSGRRISPNDPDLRPQFTNARLYLISKSADLSWTTRKLEIQESMGYSVTNATYQYYVPEFGKPVVEARFAMNNQGTPEVALDIPGTATYLEVNGQPQVLYKSPEGKLLVQIPSGASNVYLQYRPEQEAGHVVAGYRAELVKPGTVLSNVTVSLLTPSKWKVLFGSSLVGTGSDFDTEALIYSLAMALLFFGAARLWKFSRRATQGLIVAGAVLGFISGTTILFFGIPAVLLLVAHYRALLLGFLKGKPVRALILLIVVGVPLLMVTTFVTNSFIGTSRHLVGKSLSQYNYEQQAAPAASGSMNAFGNAAPKGGGGTGGSADATERGAPAADAPREETGEGAAASYQGLPARIDIPTNVNYTSFNQTMVDQKGTVILRALLVSSSVIGAIYFAFLLGTLAMLWLRRKLILDWAMASN